MQHVCLRGPTVLHAPGSASAGLLLQRCSHRSAWQPYWRIPVGTLVQGYRHVWEASKEARVCRCCARPTMPMPPLCLRYSGARSMQNRAQCVYAIE